MAYGLWRSIDDKPSAISHQPWSWSRSPTAPCDRLETNRSSNRRGDDAQLRHQAIELRGEHRLRAVGERVIRIAVHLDDQAAGARGNRRADQRRHHVAAP